MFKLLPAYWLFPLLVGLPTLWIIFCKGHFETTAQLTYLGWRFNWIRMAFRQFAQFGFIAIIHYWLYAFLVTKKKMPAILLNSIFYGAYFEIFGFGMYDFEYTRINMQMVLPSIFTTYAGRFGGDTSVWDKPISDIPTSEVKVVVAKNLIVDSIKDSPVFWISTIIFILCWIIAQIVLLYVYRGLVIASAYYETNEYRFPKISILNQADIRQMKWIPAHQYKNAPFIIAHVFAALHVCYLFGTFCIPSDFKLQRFSYLPYLESIFLSFSHFEKKLTQATSANLKNIVRTYLPPGRRWLDNRKDPVFPAVHGDMAAYCAYNNEDPECKDFKPPEQKPLTSKLPNVCVILYESLTPCYTILNKEFITEHVHLKPNDKRKIITDTPYYGNQVLKNLHEFQKTSITFAGLTSLGIPTASGYHGFNTGLVPSQTFNNIIDGTMAHADDFPSVMQHYGYRTFFTCSSMFSFDGLSNWVWRHSARDEALTKLKCKEGYGYLIDDPIQKKLLGSKWPEMVDCDENEVKKLEEKLIKKRRDFPRWYDNAFAYTPSKENIEALGLDPATLRLDSTWPSDRITAAQYRTHWNQIKRHLNKTGSNSPIFGHYLTIEAHLPYYGYDKPDFYEPLNKTNIKDADTLRNERFIQVNKFSDKYSIGETLEFLRKNDPNTIVVITGDHGTRDIPIRYPDMKIYDDIIYSSDCISHSSGTDSFFVVSGVIGYLGDDPEVKKALALDKLAGKTVKIPTDHSDIVYTLEDILSRLNGTTVPPTHRRSRNLIDLTLNITKTLEESPENGVDKVRKDIAASGWKSVSLTSFNCEYREGPNILRTHPADPSESHHYINVSFPTCMRLEGSKPMELGTPEGYKMNDRMFQFMSATTFLQFRNRMFHYSFRDPECIKKGKCEFGEPSGMVFNDKFFAICLILVPIATFVLLGVIPELLAMFFYKIVGATNSEELKLNPEGNEAINEEMVDFTNDALDDLENEETI